MELASLPVTQLKGVGPKLAEKLERLNIRSIQDVLFHLPYRYQDRTHISPIGSVQPGAETSVVGTVELADVVYRKRRSLLVRISDGTGMATLRFFYFNATQQERFRRGARLRCFGEARLGPNGIEFIHPEYEFISADEEPGGENEDSLTPVYHATEGVHQLTLRKLIDQALLQYLPKVSELLPSAVNNNHELSSLSEAISLLHHPTPDSDIDALIAGTHPAQQRLAFEELLAFQLSLRASLKDQQQYRAPAIENTEVLSALLSRFGFTLTAAQQRVADEISADLKRGRPMHRLVQGDVGCGKTVVAAAAAVQAIACGYQVAMMAPTELLAEQHYRNLDQWLQPLGINVTLLVSRLAAPARQQALDQISNGEAGMVVGTHALFQEGVHYHRLGLVIVDEQHRFGVHQRLALLEKGRTPEAHLHQLVMTATPIPRTLAQTLYADLDVSVIDELPPGRLPVQTVVIPDNRRDEVVQRVQQACASGQQVYWVCPLIEESEAMELQAATDMEASLREALPQLKIGLVHGRQRSRDKEKVMQQFKSGELDLLVATTVIEVGVDVPNANLMVIENAERLGLSQLHQLRGRVGRGSTEAACVLLYQSPLSELARKRLGVMRETSDGFEIARQDLELRGPGELFGTRQTGMPRFRIADLARDQQMLPRVQQTADRILAEFPASVGPLVGRWLGSGELYSKV